MGAQGPYGQPPAPKDSSKVLLWVLLAIGVVMLLVVGALVVVRLGSDTTTATTNNKTSRPTGQQSDPGIEKSIIPDAPETGVKIIDGEGDRAEEVVAAAIADVEEFWTGEMPATYQQDYEPVTGGFFSVSPNEQSPPCTESALEVEGNAFYCSTEDVVAWDDKRLIPDLLETYGDLSVAIVFAHEFGHAIQARVGFQGATVTLEQQADCFAGAWVRHVEQGNSEYFTVTGKALDQALAGFLEIADQPGTSAIDPNAHGSAFDRINSFQEGFEAGNPACANYSDETVGPRLVEIPFQDDEDAANNGNAPYEDILTYATNDLEDYWRVVSESVFSTTWEPLNPAVPFENGEVPSCGDSDTSGFSLFYCAPERFIAFDNEGLFPQVYDGIGDMGVGMLYGSQYSLAAQDQLGISPEDPKQQNLLADCMTGSWAASVFLQNRETAALVLSPGDFDEAIKALLAFGASDDDESTQGTGFERVIEFRKGVLGGIRGCTGG